MDEQNNNQNEKKVQALREMIYNAEKTLQGAKAMLLQLEGKKKVGRRKKAEEDEDGGRIVEGTFDGQIMMGSDAKQYPVPANYASKSKLVEGDMLKLTITEDGSFIYKQISPAARRIIIGTVNQDAGGNYFIAAEGRAYKVLLASITYFKVEPGDEVTLVVPRDMDSDWGAIENVLQRSFSDAQKPYAKPEQPRNIDDIMNDNQEKSSPAEIGPVSKEETAAEKEKGNMSIIDEWTPDLEELKKELGENNQDKRI